MNTELFIARRIFNNSEKKKNISRAIIYISTTAIILGISVMIISISVSTGFKREIRKKISGFGSHISITNFDSNASFESIPVDEQQIPIEKLKKVQNVEHLQAYAIKPGIIKTADEIKGVVLKGIDQNFDWSFLTSILKNGKKFSVNDSVKNDSIIISEKIANILKLSVGDKAVTYFVQQPVRVRKFIVAGIFSSTLEDFDNILICDIRHIQKLNNWSETEVTGIEIFINNFDLLEETNMKIKNIVEIPIEKDKQNLKVETITEKFPQLFDWINLFDINTTVILILMIVVAGFNMISGLLIIILERTITIGILKSIGCENASIRKIFLYLSTFITVRGLIAGNLIGIGICLLQQYFHLFKLDARMYYVDNIPVELNILHLLLLNAGTLLVTVSMLLIPSMLVSRINPEKAIRFE